MRKKQLFFSLVGLVLVWFSCTISADVYADTPLFRLYHSKLQVHLYTKDKNEYAVLGNRGWKQEGEAWMTADAEGDVVYRLYHSGLRVHLYTKDKNEYSVLAKRGWKQEGPAFRSHGTTPIYRLYHTGLKKHLYTKDKNEYTVLAKRGWRQEGIAFYGLGKQGTQPAPKPVTTTKVIAKPKPVTTTKAVTKAKPVTTTAKPKTITTTVASQTPPTAPIAPSKPVIEISQRTEVLTTDEVQNLEDANLEVGKTLVVESINGERVIEIRKTIQDGKVINTEEKVIKETPAQPKKIYKGTKVVTTTATTTKVTTTAKPITTTGKPITTTKVTTTKPVTTTKTTTTAPVSTKVVTNNVTYKLTFSELIGANQYSPVQEVTVVLPEKTTINTKNNQVLSREPGVTRESAMKYVLSSLYDFVEIADRKTSPLYHANDKHFNIVVKKKAFDINAFVAEIKTKTPEERYQIATSAVANPVKYQREFTQDELNLIKSALNDKLYNQELLKTINDARAKVGVAALKLDEELAQGVKTRADEQGAEGFFRSVDTTGDTVGDKSHTRPNGDRFATAFNYVKTISLRSENAGQYLPDDIRELISEKWQAEKQFALLYSSTEHKNAMLSKSSNVAYFAMAFSDDHKILIYRNQQKNREDVNGNGVIFIQIFGSKRAY